MAVGPRDPAAQGGRAASCPNLRAPNKKTANPPSPWGKDLTAITQQSPSASAKQRKRKSNHQNWSPSNPMMLFIGRGMLCSVQRASKMPQLCAKGVGKWVARAGPSPGSTNGTLTDSKQEEEIGHERPLHASSCDLQALFKVLDHRAAALREGSNASPVGRWCFSGTWHLAFLSVTTLNFFRENSLPALSILVALASRCLAS